MLFTALRTNKEEILPTVNTPLDTVQYLPKNIQDTTRIVPKIIQDQATLYYRYYYVYVPLTQLILDTNRVLRMCTFLPETFVLCRCIFITLRTI